MHFFSLPGEWLYVQSGCKVCEHRLSLLAISTGVNTSVVDRLYDWLNGSSRVCVLLKPTEVFTFFAPWFFILVSRCVRASVCVLSCGDPEMGYEIWTVTVTGACWAIGHTSLTLPSPVTHVDTQRTCSASGEGGGREGVVEEMGVAVWRWWWWWWTELGGEWELGRGWMGSGAGLEGTRALGGQLYWLYVLLSGVCYGSAL